ncbi:hypothetical protein DFJ58DRAFT_717694 [Suillus subalutaceus]|uniref:uncharacterized protein n=1 Tax=Suillus subalutaceus TaxID=48586 RepID=UPI001B887119|nr:uncharacterized protein DFJ58DRAFT_717694 [Suillus subalutaceus]KAG1844079.1 hypothetical protein DFJ58DRAFT_717694 [Suillus subalutaceus]
MRSAVISDLGWWLQLLRSEHPPYGRVRIPHHPRKDTTIASSSHRPHVLASERDTHSNYSTGLLCFTQFCDLHSVPEPNCMPTSSKLLAAFLANAAGTVSSSAANSWMADLHYWHSVNGADWHGGESDVLCHVRRGLSKLTPPSSKCSKCSKCPPMILTALLQLASGLNLSNSFDITVFAIACVAFCLGELLIPSPNTFDPVKHVNRSILPISVLDTDNVHCTTLQIPWTKTINTEGAAISIMGHMHSTCPLNTLVHHLQSNLNIPSHAPLFSFETAASSWSPLTKPWFLARCNEVWVSAGHPSMPGHAFHIGRATELLLEGGCWKSCTFLEYWHQIESIPPLLFPLLSIPLL